jgi:membrane associated rhomboid family serine protease
MGARPRASFLDQPLPKVRIVLQLFSGVGSVATTSQTTDQGGVAYMAHVGGFVAGLVLTFFFRGGRDTLPAGRG